MEGFLRVLMMAGRKKPLKISKSPSKNATPPQSMAILLKKNLFS
jgi:hypothetical protein